MVVRSGIERVVVVVVAVKPVDMPSVIVHPTSREVTYGGNLKTVVVLRVLGGNTSAQGGTH